VNLIVLLASPSDQAGPHIQALARISRLMTIESFRHALDKATTAQEVYEVIARQEDAMAGAATG
jgi:mannitol/fructose-specific phosphotransferase system IIA component (Ntr-type)